jgi:hypothetical protein
MGWDGTLLLYSPSLSQTSRFPHLSSQLRFIIRSMSLLNGAKLASFFFCSFHPPCWERCGFVDIGIWNRKEGDGEWNHQSTGRGPSTGGGRSCGRPTKLQHSVTMTPFFSSLYGAIDRNFVDARSPYPSRNTNFRSKWRQIRSRSG